MNRRDEIQNLNEAMREATNAYTNVIWLFGFI